VFVLCCCPLFSGALSNIRRTGLGRFYMRVNTSLLLVTIFGLFVTLATCAFAEPTDACAVLTATQVSSVVGIAMKPGTHPTPTFLRTCTWEPSSGPTATIKAVTFYIQSTDKYDQAKQMLNSGKMKE